MAQDSSRSKFAESGGDAPVPRPTAPDDQIIYSHTTLNVRILAPNPDALGERSLRSAWSSIELMLAAQLGTSDGRAERDVERDALLGQMRTLRLPIETIVGVWDYVLYQSRYLIQRKNLNQIVLHLMKEFDDLQEHSPESEVFVEKLDSILRSRSPLVTKKARQAIKDARKELITNQEITCSEEKMRGFIEVRYDAWPGLPFSEREEDLDFLLGRFWKDGRFQTMKRAQRAPRKAPWPELVAAVAGHLCKEGLSRSRAAKLASDLFSLELLQTRLLPEEFSYTFSPRAIRTSLFRSQRAPNQ